MVKIYELGDLLWIEVSVDTVSAIDAAETTRDITFEKSGELLAITLQESRGSAFTGVESWLSVINSTARLTTLGQFVTGVRIHVQNDTGTGNKNVSFWTMCLLRRPAR